jgi:hypothetical protein
MTPDHTWLFYSQAASNTDQAAYIAKTLIDNPPDPSCYATKVTWFAAYNFSIVSYCSPFMKFATTEGKKNKLEEGLGEDVVPNELLGFHTQIRNYRNKILAHSDISHMRAYGLGDGFPVASVDAQFSAPSIDDSFVLFSGVSKVLLKKLADIENKNKMPNNKGTPNS